MANGKLRLTGVSRPVLAIDALSGKIHDSPRPHLQHFGRGPCRPVLLLHGCAEPMHCWAAELCRLENVALQMKKLHRSKWSNTTWPAKIGISARRPSVNNSRARVRLHGHPRKVARRF